MMTVQDFMELPDAFDSYEEFCEFLYAWMLPLPLIEKQEVAQ